MSIAQFRQLLEEFLQNNNNELLILKGRWGVGKTHFWRDMLDKANQNKQLGKPKYAYVSLFGINSLQELKDSLFASIVEIDLVNEESNRIDVFKSTWNKGANLLRKTAKPALKIPFLEKFTGSLASTYLFLLVRDCLICFDDLERKGKDLTFNDLLGLASLLKDQRKCHIAFILNENSIHPEDLMNFWANAEKIVDIELEFTPTLNEAFDLVFTNKYPHYEYIQNRCITLSIANIRIIQRIKRFVDIVLPHLEEVELLVTQTVLSSLVLFAWCRYDKENGAPGLSYMRSFSLYVELYREGKGKDSGQASNWNNLLQSYGYFLTDDLDHILIRLVETGYLNILEFAQAISKKNQEAQVGKSQELYRSAWHLYHGSFDNNQTEFVDALVRVFRDNMSNLSPRDLQSTVSILEDLEDYQIASSLIEEYLSLRTEHLTKIDIDHFTFLFDIENKELLDRVRAIQEQHRQREGIPEIIQRISTRQSWGDSDIDFLAQTSTDDYYYYFKSQNSEDLTSQVRLLLQFQDMVTVKEQYREIASKTRQALQRIAAEGPLNRIRVRNLYKIQNEHQESAEE